MENLVFEKQIRSLVAAIVSIFTICTANAQTNPVYDSYRAKLTAESSKENMHFLKGTNVAKSDLLTQLTKSADLWTKAWSTMISSASWKMSF